jgi:hypothetical protein
VPPERSVTNTSKTYSRYVIHLCSRKFQTVLPNAMSLSKHSFHFRQSFTGLFSGHKNSHQQSLIKTVWQLCLYTPIPRNHPTHVYSNVVILFSAQRQNVPEKWKSENPYQHGKSLRNGRINKFCHCRCKMNNKCVKELAGYIHVFQIYPMFLQVVAIFRGVVGALEVTQAISIEYK